MFLEYTHIYETLWNLFKDHVFESLPNLVTPSILTPGVQNRFKLTLPLEGPMILREEEQNHHKNTKNNKTITKILRLLLYLFPLPMILREGTKNISKAPSNPSDQIFSSKSPRPNPKTQCEYPPCWFHGHRWSTDRVFGGVFSVEGEIFRLGGPGGPGKRWRVNFSLKETW